MKKVISIGFAVLALGCRTQADSTPQAGLDGAQINRAATNASSLFLDGAEKVRVVETFLKLVRIKGVSGQEQAIREEVKRLLTAAGATEFSVMKRASNAFPNLLMEIPGTGAWTNQPGILLNAHLDTIAQSTPDRIKFDPATGDFFHQDDPDPRKISSFGGDDRSGVAVIVEAVRKLQADYWRRGIAHRRIVLLFTADEERGCVGAKYLSQNEPDIFSNLNITLSMDGPLDYQTDYPKDRLVTVVSAADSMILPYKRVLQLTQDFCGRTKLRSLQTEAGLGYGDFAFFPPTARSGLHLRSPVRGWHNHERVNVRDLINHVDLVCYLLLGWDHSLPAKISPETLLSPAR